MSVPYYFVSDPSVNLRKVFNATLADPVAASLEYWESHGLGDVVRDNGGNIGAAVSNGPENTSGVWVAVWPDESRKPEPYGYHPDVQTWKQVRRDVWVGFTTDSPPTPADFCRGNPHGLSGEAVQLCDGNFWVVPELREPVFNGQIVPTPIQSTDLPKLVQRDLDGNLCKPVKREFDDVWETSGKWFDTWLEITFSERSTFDSEDALAFCLQVLKLRYRICDLTNDAFGLLDTQNFQKVICLAIGWQPVRDLLEARLAAASGDDDPPTQKKSDEALTSGDASGSSGPEGSEATTDPHAANNISPVKSDTDVPHSAAELAVTNV